MACQTAGDVPDRMAWLGMTQFWTPAMGGMRRLLRRPGRSRCRRMMRDLAWGPGGWRCAG